MERELAVLLKRHEQLMTQYGHLHHDLLMAIHHGPIGNYSYYNECAARLAKHQAQSSVVRIRIAIVRERIAIANDVPKLWDRPPVRRAR